MRKQSKSPRSASREQGFEQTYPAIAHWIDSWGWIEIGQDGYSRSMARALDEGGMVWEGKAKYPSMDELLRDLEKGLSRWLEKNG
jgi:hypothetical protein